MSSDDLAQLDIEWKRWRPEWARRKKTFTSSVRIYPPLRFLEVHVDWHCFSFWQLATDALPPQDATALMEDLGIEFDTPEHTSLERGPLCAVPGQIPKPSLKRKRE